MRSITEACAIPKWVMQCRIALVAMRSFPNAYGWVTRRHPAGG